MKTAISVMKQGGGLFPVFESDKPLIHQLPPETPITALLGTPDSATAAQLGLYWVWMKYISESIHRYTPELLHGFFAAKFLSRTVVELGDSKEVPRESIGRLKKRQFAAYLLQIDTWCRDQLGLTLPRPHHYRKAFS